MAYRRTSLGNMGFCWMGVGQEGSRAPGESPSWNPAQRPLLEGGWGGSCRSLIQSRYPFHSRNALLWDIWLVPGTCLREALGPPF